MVKVPFDNQWSEKGTIVAGNDINDELSLPYGFFIDADDQTIVIADHDNNRIIQWRIGDMVGEVVAGGNGPGNRLDQLDGPTDVLIDKKTDSFIISDSKNRRIIQWSRSNEMKQAKILINNIDCFGLAIDNQRNIYVSDVKQNEIKQYNLEGDMKNGIVVAGGNGEGSDLNQFEFPTYIFVDKNQNIYISDWSNHRVVKWIKGANEGIIIAGGQGEGNDLTQMSNPSGIFVDELDVLYVADLGNNRIMYWTPEAAQGVVIVGEKAQLKWPMGISFDCRGNLYVVDSAHGHILRFSAESRSNSSEE